jgi:diacylglycerol O-acyltransferase/trehalose O-mycolyltransferase
MGAHDVGRRVLVGLTVLILLAGCGASASPTPAAGGAATSASPSPFFNTQANPQADIDAAIAAAKADGRRVLIDFGANWCQDCTALAADFASPQVKPFLDANFHVVPVYIGNWDTNMAVAGKYKAASTYMPMIAILDGTGANLYQSAGLQNAHTMSVAEVMTYLQKWAPSPTPTSASVPSTAVATPTETATPTPTPIATSTLIATIGKPADDGARIVKVSTLDARTRDLTIDSPAVGTVMVRLLIPSQFDTKPSTRWPVLYLLHGATMSHEAWTDSTDVVALTAATDLLVVMPDAGSMGFYSDWWNGGAGGPPKWETFHLVELRQLLERNWHAGDKRVVAGLSMGGYGAMEYAERQPGMFLAAASFSGVVDPLGGWPTIGSLAPLGMPAWPTALWGDPATQANVWKAHDPTTNAAALKGTALYVAYGNGQPGTLDASGTSADVLEQWVAPQNETFVHQLATLKIPATVDAYGAGTHTWPYWQRALHRSLPLLLKALGE